LPNLWPFGILQTSSVSGLVTCSGAIGFFSLELWLDLDESLVSPEWIDSLDKVKDFGSSTEGTIPPRMLSMNLSTLSLMVCLSLHWALQIGSFSNE
jgi:hypothetical protein